MYQKENKRKEEKYNGTLSGIVKVLLQFVNPEVGGGSFSILMQDLAVGIFQLLG